MKTLASKLEVGGKYLHNNGLFVRIIRDIDDKEVFYQGASGAGRCSKATFARVCPKLATEEDHKKEIDFNIKYGYSIADGFYPKY